MRQGLLDSAVWLIATTFVLFAGIATSACDGRYLACSAAPTSQIVGFEVTTVTGGEPSSATISFCFTRKSTAAEECMALDHAGGFEAHEVDTYSLDLDSPVEAGDLDGFLLRNSGGSPPGAWTLDGLRVEGVLESGDDVRLYLEEEMGERLDEGDTYDSSQCEY